MRTVMEPSTRFDHVIPDWKDLHLLCGEDGPCVTVYLNRHAPGSGTVSQSERIRRGTTEMKEQLLGRGLAAPVVEILLEPLGELAAEGPGTGRSESLAIFCSVHGPARFRVPWEMEDAMLVEGRFVVKPLWEAMRRNRRLYALLLARNDVRLLECYGTQYQEVRLPVGFPRSLDTFGDFDQPDHLLRNRSSAGPGVGAMKGVAFGTGAGRDKDYIRLREFHRAIHAALLPLLPEPPRCPLVLAGTEADIASYASVNCYEPTVGDVVLGSTDDGTSDAMLAGLARQAAMDSLGDAERRALQRYERAGIGRKTVELLEAVRSAAEGRVADLFVTAGTAPQFGNLDEICGRAIEPAHFLSNNDELVNAAMVETVRRHGHVWLLSPEQMPDNVSVAALWRY